MQFNFNFEAFEQSGKEKNEAINYLKSLNSSIDFDKLEQETKGDESAIYEALKGGNFSFSKPSIEQTRQKLLKNKENEALKAEFNAGLSWLGEEKKQNFNFYDFKKAKEKANSKQGLIQADLKEKERQMQKKEALFETRLKERGIIAKSFDDMLDQSGAYLGADLLEKGLNKLGFKDENYIFESEKEDIKSRALKSVREKLERGDLEFNEREKHALRSKYDEPDYKKALEKEKERLRLSQKSGNFSEAEREFIENDLGFFNTLFNDDKENIKEFKEKVKSEGVISSEIIKAANTLKAFDEGNLFKNMLFADEKEKKEFQQNFLNDAYKIAELSGFDDVGLDKKGELYFIKDEQKYLVNTGFFDNFAQLLNDTKFEFAGGVLGGMKGFNSGKSAKGKVAKSILGAAAGSFGGAFLDAKIADMYLNRESDFKKNLDFAIQAGLLSMAGDGVILSVKPLAKGLYKGVKKGGEILGEYSVLGGLKTLPTQNIQAAEKIIDEVFSPKMKEELKAAQEEFGGSVRGEDLKNAFFANLQKKFTQKYGENDSKTKSVAKIAEIFNTNSLKTRQQAMLDLVRSDTHGSTLAYLLEIAKDDVKIQSNLKNMLNLASSNVEKNLKNLNINAREIKHILDEFEAGNKAAFKEVESQIARLYDENYRVVLSKGEYENIKEEFRQNGVNLEEMTPFLRDLEANVFNEKGVTFTQLNNFRKNLNFYIFNKDKTPNFINTLKKIGENILKNEIDKGIDNIFSQNKAAYESIKELYSTSLKDYATLKSLNESIKNLKLQDSAKSADEVLNSLIKYAKGQGEKGVNNLQKIKDYLGEENNAFLEMQILNKLFKESVVENDRAGVRVFDSESFLGRVRELVGENELYERKIGKEFLEELSPSAMPKQISIDEFLNTLENFKNKENFLKHIEKDPKRKDYLNLIEPTLKEPDIAFKKLENGVEKEKFIKKFSDGKDFFYLLATKDNKETILTAFKTDKINTILKEFNADIIPTFIRQGSKGKAAGTTNEGIITQPLFKSKEAREFLELVEGFHKLYKNDASIAKNLVQGTSEKLSTSIATSAEGAIKQKVVKGGFDPIFRLLPDKILFGLFAKQIQGGALRYHLKKALSRSLNYDDFKIKLEKELKRTNFNSNTSRLIDEFMQNLDTFNAEKEAKLAKIREEQARIKEEEQARINAIKTAQENAYNAQEANLGKDILEAEEKPLKDEFGVNFEGFKGKEAINKLLEEQRGQVKGAFYKEGLGEIDLVWGDENFGLRHILNKHGGEFKNLAKELSEAVENGKIVKDDKGRLRLEYENKIVAIKDNWKGEKTAHWVVTAYVKKEKEASLYTSASFTKGETLPLNSKESIAQKALNLHEKLYLKDNDTPLNVEYKIVNKDDIKPTFTLSKTQFRSQKQEDLIKKIKENFNPDLLVNIRGDLKKGNPIITKEGEVISGNHRAAALKELEGENLAKYQNAVKEAFGVELKENEMLVRVADTSEAEIRRFSAASNEGLENNLGEQGVSLFAKYQDKIKALKEAKKPFVADDVYNLKYLVNKALGESSITKENDTSKALFASLARGRNNTILKALNELEKENLEQVSKVANMFFDNAGAFYNLTHDLDLPKMQNLQNYFSDVLVSAAKADFTRAEDFARLNEDIRAFLDSGDKNAMLKLSPNLVSDLLAKAMGAGFARFARLENPSASLYEFLNGLKKDLLEKGAPDLFSGGKGIKLNERDEFDFAKELILKGQDSEEKFRLYQNLEELKAWKSKSSLNQPTKESLDKDLNKSYTLELENLEPVSLNANALSKETEALNQSVESGHKQSATIAKTDEESIAQNAKNDEVLEAEVIEEVGLNEPMKFLEFQQRKLLTYIKENTPLRLLEHKKELKTRDILNFLEQSALNGKQKVFLMRNLERDLGKLELKIKENESVKAKIKNTYEISQSEAKELGEHFNFKGKKPLLRELRENEIKHALKSHGNKESEEARGNIAITLQDIEANYPKITQEFDEKFFTQKGVIYVKQVNGHHIVIEEALSGQDKLIFKTMWKTKGNYNKEVLLKNAKTSPYPQNADEAVRLETISKQELEQSNPQQSHLSTDESITQNSQEAKIKEAVKNHNAIYKEILDNDYIFTDERSKMFRKRKRELIENLAKDEKVQAFTSQWGYPFKKDGELRGIGLNYKAKVYGKGDHKMMYVDGGAKLFESAQQKKRERLLELEKERLQEAFKADFGIDGFISKYVEDDFFEILWEKTKAYKGIDYGWGVHPREYYPYYENRIMLSDTITQAKEKLQKEKLSWSVKRQEAKESEDIIFTDKKGKEHTLTKETQKAWLEAFNLKSLEEAYIPNFKAEVKEAINRVLGGEEIKLTKGSFEKLLKRDREEFLPYIKDTLEKADLIIKDKENALIFVKDIGKKSYFTSVAKNANNEWVISTNSLKTLNTLKNRVDDNGEVLYLSKEAPNILAEAFTKRAFSNELAKDIIPQKPQQKALNLQEIEQSLKARKSQINDEISANDKAFKENLKEVSKVKPILEALKKEWEALEPTIVTWTHTDYSKAKPKKYYKRKPNLSNLWHIEETLDVYKGYARESDRHANQVAREIALLEKYVKLLKDKEAEVKAFKAKAEADENALILESRIIPIYNQLREAFKKGHHTTKQILEANNIKQDSVQAKEVIDSIAQTRQYLEDTFNIKPLKEFGTNYAEFYRDGKGAVEKLLAEKQGQVAGAFYKEGLGEIDLVWGEAGSGKSDGFGLAKIVKYHPEVIDKLDDIIANTSIVKESDNRYHLENENYKLAIRKDFEGEKTNWLLTAFEKKDSIARRRTDLPSTQSEAEKTTSANANEIIPQEIEQAEIKKLLEEYGEQISSNYPQETARLILEQNKNDGIVLSGFKIKGKSYDPEIEAMQFKTKKAEREFESLMESYDIKGDFLNFKEAYSFKPNDEAFLQYLAKYEGDENAKLALAYNLAKQLVMRRGGGRAEVYTTDFLRQMHILENQNSTTLHSNPHLGAGLVGGVLNGVEQDENGNLSFDPVKFAMGFLGGSVGSFALKKGFQILEKNPELKEKIINELADTLAQGFEKAREKYSLLNLLEPRYIVQNEKGRKIQAKTMLKELEREQNKNLQNIIRQNLQNLPLNNKPLELSEKQVKLLINRFANARNLKEHLNTRADNRKELYALLNDTLENPQIHFIKEGRDKYVKRYKGDVNEPYFYLLITQDKDKIFITHLKTRDIKYLSRQISNAEQIKKGADIIEALSQRAGDDKASASKKDYSK
ncbi:PBECR2 nuclease fold domain-containing protein [Campylobacter upsaliensis]